MLLKQVKYLGGRGCARHIGSDVENYIDIPFSRLDCASFFGIEDLVYILKQMECYRNWRGALESIPLEWAARDGHEEVVQTLLGGPFARPQPWLFRPDTANICYSVWNERVMEILLTCRSVDPNRPDGRRKTPLSCAARDGLEEGVKIPLQRGADPNNRDNSGNTPLSFGAGMSGW